ncbi:hypothetical protein Tco_0127835 [Tanacetum coccineum]
MTTLKFADTYNMVAFLAKLAESEGFEQIVDFLNAHTIKYALMINPTIYTSCIEQFWATVKAKTVNEEVQLQALVDEKKIILTESIVRRDLQLKDAEGVDCLPNATIFEQLTLIGYEAVNKEMDDSLVRAATTASSLEAEQDSGNIDKTQSKATPNEPSSPGTSSGGGPRRQETMGDTIAQTRSENVSKLSNDPLLARGNTLRSGEDSLKLQELMALCTTLQSRVLNLETTKTTQANEIASLKRRVKKLEQKKRSRTHGLKRLYKIGSSRRVESSDEEGLGEEDASKHGRIADIDANKDIYLVNVHTDEDMFGVNDLDGDEVIVDNVNVVKTAEETRSVVKEVTDVIEKAKLVSVAEETVNAAATIVSIASTIPVSVVTTTTVSDVEITLAQALAELKSAKRKADKVVIQEPEHGTTTTTLTTTVAATITTASTRPKVKVQDKGKGKMVEPELVNKMSKKDLLRLDEELAFKLQAEEEEEERLAREKAQQIEKANIAWDDVHAKLEADYHMAQRLQAQEEEELTDEEKPKSLKNKSFANIQELFDKAMKRVNTFVDYITELVEENSKKDKAEIAQERSSKRAGEELEQESIKKQKVDEDKETTELQSLIEIVPDEEEVAIDAIPLATKPPTIVDWKIHKEGKNNYYQIIRADESSKMYRVFSQMLKGFDRQDLEDLYKLVKAKYGSTRPVEDLDLILYGDLNTMFDPHVKDRVWRNQQDYKVLDWKIYDSRRVHSLRMQHVYIHMLVEKRYPLTPATITDMLNKKLQCDHFSEIVYQLLKLLTKQLKNQ